MPDSKSRRDIELAKYEAMSTEELQAILREDASKPEGEESNEDVLFYVMEVLARRRQARKEGKSPEEALESFVKNYMPEDDGASGSESESTARRRRSGPRRWISGLVAAAAMLVLVFGMSLTANAFGFDVWEIIVQWTQDTFHFSYTEDNKEDNNPSKEDAIPYSELQALLDDYHVSIALVPRQFPEGYTEGDARVVETPKQRQFIAQYQSGENVIKIWIADYLDSDPVQIEQSGAAMEIYESGGVKYYIFSDMEQVRAAWIRESYECCITGPISVEELKALIDSIEKG